MGAAPTDSDFSRSLELVVARVRAGDRGGQDAELRGKIGALFGDHLDALHRFSADQLRGFAPQQVEEVAADAMMVAWEKLDTFEGNRPREFRAWLFAIAKGKCANLRRRRREELPGEDALFEAGSCAADALRRLRDQERERVYAVAVRVLEPEDQEVFWMRHVDAWSQEEIAERLGLADADEVRTRLQKCRRRLAVEVERILRELGHGRSLLRPDSHEDDER